MTERFGFGAGERATFVISAEGVERPGDHTDRPSLEILQLIQQIGRRVLRHQSENISAESLDGASRGMSGRSGVDFQESCRASRVSTDWKVSED